MKLDEKLETILIDILDAIIARYERHPDYPFIDTKLDLIAGRDFDENDVWYKRRDIIYPWIQGRGIEMLAGHLAFLPTVITLSAAQKRARQRKIEKMLGEITGNMEQLRRKNHGRMFFMMTADGRFVRPDAEGGMTAVESLPHEQNYSDLFYAKGLFAAGSALGNRRWKRHGENYLRRLVRGILAERFITDQQAFDPKNPVTAVPGKLLQGPKMIALDGAAIGMDHGDAGYWERRSLKLISRVFERYINLEGKYSQLRKYDFWEAVDPKFQPLIENGALVADPGHSLEFIGLSVKNVLKFKTPAGKKFAAAMREVYPAMLRHYFEIGFNRQSGGIIKSYDLLARKPLNDDMPGWSLPETIRAAALTVELSGDESLTAVIRDCADAFMTHYSNPNCHSMPFQTRSADGKVVPVIPATPDIDPSYHTGLTLIDALPVIRRCCR